MEVAYVIGCSLDQKSFANFSPSFSKSAFSGMMAGLVCTDQVRLREYICTRNMYIIL